MFALDQKKNAVRNLSKSSILNCYDLDFILDKVFTYCPSEIQPSKSIFSKTQISHLTLDLAYINCWVYF